MGIGNLSEGQKKKIYNKLALMMPLIGLNLQILALVIPTVIYSISQNWAYLIIMLIAQFGIMPGILLICGSIGLICSILALKKIRFRKRYVVSLVLSVIELILGIVLFCAMPRVLGGM